MDILITEDLSAPALTRLGERFAISRQPALWKDTAALEMAIQPARALVIRNQTQVTAELLAGAPRLLAIGRVGVGLDNIDVAAATKLGIVVIAPLDANAVSVAELTFGLVLALARKLCPADRSTKAGAWDRKTFTGTEIQGKTIGLCGLGRIGRLVALRAKAFGMTVLAFDPFVRPDSPALKETGATLCAQLEEMLSMADFVTVHSPLTRETRHLFNARTLAAMKRGACFINTSRGPIVDEAALVSALRNGQLGGAALDVREAEPPLDQTGFEGLDNVLLTPHIGAFTVEAQTRTFEAVASDLERVLSGEPAVHFVNRDRPSR